MLKNTVTVQTLIYYDHLPEVVELSIKSTEILTFLRSKTHAPICEHCQRLSNRTEALLEQLTDSSFASFCKNTHSRLHNNVGCFLDFVQNYKARG